MDPSLMVSCKQVLCAEDAVQAVQWRRTHARRCYGPASDAEFLRSIADKTPGRDDDKEAAMRRRRQVYLKSYAFATAAEAKGKPAGRGGPRARVDAVLPPTLLRRRKTTHDDATCSGNKTTTAASSGFTSISNPSSMWCPRNAGKVLSQMLTRLVSCACNPGAAPSSA